VDTWQAVEDIPRRAMTLSRRYLGINMENRDICTSGAIALEGEPSTNNSSAHQGRAEGRRARRRISAAWRPRPWRRGPRPTAGQAQPAGLIRSDRGCAIPRWRLANAV